MRQFLSYLFAVLTLAAVASAQPAPRLIVKGELPLVAGQVMTVRVENAPDSTTLACFDVSAQVHGLLLYPQGDGVWEGSFALLPSMQGQTFQPRVQLYAADRSAVVLNSSRSWKVASAGPRPSGLVTVTESGRAAVAFDQTIRLDSLELLSGSRHIPVVATPRNNLLLLPPAVDLSQVDAISALNLEGERVTVRGPVHARRIQLLSSVDISAR